MPSSNATTNLSGNVSTDVNNPTVITIPGNPKMVFLTLYGTGLVAYGRNGETVAVPPAPKSTASAANSCPMPIGSQQGGIQTISLVGDTAGQTYTIGMFLNGGYIGNQTS